MNRPDNFDPKVSAKIKELREEDPAFGRKVSDNSGGRNQDYHPPIHHTSIEYKEKRE